MRDRLIASKLVVEIFANLVGVIIVDEDAFIVVVDGGEELRLMRSDSE